MSKSNKKSNKKMMGRQRPVQEFLKDVIVAVKAIRLGEPGKGGRRQAILQINSGTPFTRFLERRGNLFIGSLPDPCSLPNKQDEVAKYKLGNQARDRGQEKVYLCYYDLVA